MCYFYISCCFPLTKASGAWFLIELNVRHTAQDPFASSLCDFIFFTRSRLINRIVWIRCVPWLFAAGCTGTRDYRHRLPSSNSVDDTYFLAESCDSRFVELEFGWLSNVEFHFRKAQNINIYNSQLISYNNRISGRNVNPKLGKSSSLFTGSFHSSLQGNCIFVDKKLN